ncbi:MAG: carboxypeptidase-like regulatory domain-containing protein [Planctomycetota bacterium]
MSPSIPVDGIVTDIDTGQPISDVLVSIERLFAGDDSLYDLDTRHLRAVSDQNGRFRILGIPPGNDHWFEAAPAKSSPYLPVYHQVSLSLEGGAKKEIEIQLKKGVWYEGRITDKTTGQPCSATVEYRALSGNPETKGVPGFDIEKGVELVYHRERFTTDIEGKYRLPGLAGPGVLLVRSYDPYYPVGSNASSVEGFNEDSGKIPTEMFAISVKDWHHVESVNPSADAQTNVSHIQLDRGDKIPGRAIGPDGQPIDRLFALGLLENEPLYWRPKYYDAIRLNDRFDVIGYDGKGPRQLFFKNEDASLVGQYRLEGEAPESIEVQLQESVQVSGRLIDTETGLPAARRFVSCRGCSLGDESPSASFSIPWMFTDDDGRFAIKGLMSGAIYDIHPSDPKDYRKKTNDFTIDLTQVEPGTFVQLGDVKAGNSQKTARPPAGEKKVARSPLVLSGAVTDRNGSPISGASLRLLENMPHQTRELSTTLATSDANGRFAIALSIDQESSKHRLDTLKFSRLVASKDGYGVASVATCLADETGKLSSLLSEFERLYLTGHNQPQGPLVMTLPDSKKPVSGHLMNSEGRPVAGAKVSTISLWEGKSGSLKEWHAETQRSDSNVYSARQHLISLLNGQFVSGPAQTIVPTAITDAAGNFKLSEIGDDRIAELIISHPSIETIRCYARSESGEIVRLSEHQNSRTSEKEFYYPNRFNIVASESIPLEGKLVDSDSGEGVPGVLVEGWRTEKHRIGGAVAARSSRATTDADGSFRLVGLPIGKSELRIAPSADSDYLLGGTRITTRVDEQVKPIIKLKRGKRLRGTVMSQLSEPISGYVDYFMLHSNNVTQQAPMLKRGDRRFRYMVDEDGKFEIPVAPGKGIVTFHASDFRHFRRAGGLDEIKFARVDDLPEAFPTWPHYLIPANCHYLVAIDVPPTGQPEPVNMTLVKGQTLRGVVQVENDDSPNRIFVKGRLPYSSWRHQEDGELVVEGYLPEEGRHITVFDPDTNTIGETQLDGEVAQEFKISLEAAGEVKGRLVDKSGEPLAGVMIFNHSHRKDDVRGLESKWRQFPTRFDNRPLMTDEEGRFVIRGLFPGRHYSAGLSLDGRIGGVLFDDLKSETGTIDLGEVTPSKHK